MLTAAILAGGRSTRFGGRDKSALVVDGRTIFDRQVSELSQIAAEILLVGGPTRPEPRPAIGPIERRLAAGQFTMTDLLADVCLRVVPADAIARFGDPHRLLANVNTPAEHESLEALHNHEL